MALTPISGKNGKVLISASSIGNVTKWTLRKIADPKSYNSSETSGRRAVLDGVHGATGTIDMLLDTAAVAPNLEGATVTLLLYVDSSHFYTVPAHIDEMTISDDINDGSPVAASFTFTNTGSLTEPTWG